MLAKRPPGGCHGPGHNSFTPSPDGREDWIVYRAIDTAGGGWSRRSVRAQPFGWNADGTPNFGAPVAVGSAIDPPSGAGTADVEARGKLRDQRRAGAL